MAKTPLIFRNTDQEPDNASLPGRKVIRLASTNFFGAPGNRTFTRVKLRLYVQSASGVFSTFAETWLNRFTWGVIMSSGDPPLETPFSPDSDPQEDWLYAGIMVPRHTLWEQQTTTGLITWEPAEGNDIDIKAQRALPTSPPFSALWLVIVQRDENGSFLNLQDYVWKLYSMVVLLVP